MDAGSHQSIISKLQVEALQEVIKEAFFGIELESLQKTIEPGISPQKLKVWVSPELIGILIPALQAS